VGEPAGDELLASLQAQLEQGLLGGRRHYDRVQVAQRSGVPLDRARRLWVAMGFAESEDPDAVSFTDGDVQALRTIAGLVDEGVIDLDDEVSVTRALGQSLSRLAEWQVTLMNTWLVEKAASSAAGGELDLDAVRAEVARASVDLVPTMEALQSYVWRRHLAAAAGRALVGPGEELTRRTLVIGFADMVGYTTLTRSLDATELTRLLERFESAAMSAVAQGHGWVVKTVGDEVMFAASDPVRAAAIALDLRRRVLAEEDLPGIRIGMAQGEVLVRFGDAYGSVVNLASRLTAAAKPDTVLVDRELAAALADDPACALKPMRALRVRGFAKLAPFGLRESDQDRGTVVTGGVRARRRPARSGSSRPA
jgi:adenylate cyclase